MSRTIRLTPDEERQLKEIAKKDPHWKVRRRAQALLLLHRGAFTTEVAEQLEVHRNSVYMWERNRERDGLDSVREGHRSGRPPQIPEEVRDTLKKLLERTGASAGQLLMELQKVHPGFSAHPNTLRNWLKRMGYAWTRVRYSLKKTGHRPLRRSPGRDRKAEGEGPGGRDRPGVFRRIGILRESGASGPVEPQRASADRSSPEPPQAVQRSGSSGGGKDLGAWEISP